MHKTGNSLAYLLSQNQKPTARYVQMVSKKTNQIGNSLAYLLSHKQQRGRKQACLLAPNSGHVRCKWECLLEANSGHAGALKIDRLSIG